MEAEAQPINWGTWIATRRPGKHAVPHAKGLYLCVHQHTCSWAYRAPNGWTKIGDYPATSLERARVKAEDLRNARGRGEDPIQQRRDQKGAKKLKVEQSQVANYSMRSLIEDYIAEHVAKRRSANARRNAARY